MSSKKNSSTFYDEIKKSLDNLSDPGNLKHLSGIEVDLIKERLRTLYDLLSGTGVKEEKPVNIVEFDIEPAESKEISPAVVEEKIQQSETDTADIESEELLSIDAEVIASEEKQVKKKDQPDLFSLDDPGNQVEKKTVIDVITDEKQKESIADKLQKQTKVESLKSAIGINEKFFFINELFEGNLNEYNAAIEALENLKSPGESAPLLEELAKKYNWEGHTEAVVQLNQFLERKFK
jgi:3,4-dihydroxy-2-butanone 4-phosphate synthase